MTRVLRQDCSFERSILGTVRQQDVRKVVVHGYRVRGHARTSGGESFQRLQGVRMPRTGLQVGQDVEIEEPRHSGATVSRGLCVRWLKNSEGNTPRDFSRAPEKMAEFATVSGKSCRRRPVRMARSARNRSG